MEEMISETSSKYSFYKESGIEWLAVIPSHWFNRPLFTIAKLKSITNRTERKLLSVYLDKGVIMFSDVVGKRTNVTSEDLSKYQAVDPGDFVLNNQQAWRGSVGVSRYEGIVSPAYLVLKLSQQLDSRFANYMFRDSTMVSQYLVCSKGVGTIQRNLYWPQLKRVRVVFPPLEEQKMIAHFLDVKTAEIDKAIVIKEKQIELLKDCQQVLINTAVTHGLNPNVKLKDSEVKWIGDIPEHWKVKRLKYISIVQSGITLGKSYVSKKLISFPYLRVANVQSGYLKLDDLAYLQLPLREAEKYFLKKGDIIVTEGGDLDKLGRGTVWNEELKDCLHQNHVFAVRVNRSVISPEYASLLMESDYGRKYFTNTANKTTNLASTNSTKLGNFPLILPPKDEMASILNYIQEIKSKIGRSILNKVKEIVKLQEYRSTLINSAVTGKIKVQY